MSSCRATNAKLEALGSILVDCKPHPEEWDGNTAAEWGADTLIAVCRVLGAIVAARDACRRAPHAEHSDRVLAKLRAMTPEELRRTFIDAGIFDESGNLTEPYRG